MSDTVCLPKDRYDFLLKCEKLVDAEFNEKFSKGLVKAVAASEEAYNKGDFIEVKDSDARKKLFESL